MRTAVLTTTGGKMKQKRTGRPPLYTSKDITIEVKLPTLVVRWLGKVGSDLGHSRAMFARQLLIKAWQEAITKERLEGPGQSE